VIVDVLIPWLNQQSRKGTAVEDNVHDDVERAREWIGQQDAFVSSLDNIEGVTRQTSWTTPLRHGNTSQCRELQG
jgi:hypothetical protein